QLARYVERERIELVQAVFPDAVLLAALLRGVTPVRLIGSFRDLGFWRDRASNLKMRLSVPLFSGFIANSRAVREHHARLERIAPERIEVIYNGLDFSRIPPSVERGGAPIVGIVGNYNRPVKRLDDFVEAARLLLDRRPEVRFQVVGDGGLMPELKRRAQCLGLGDAIEFTGRVDNPLDFVRRFSVGVITSESEGLCNAILEYLACAVPVVATATGGNDELVTEGTTGHLVPVGDVQALAGRIGDLLAEPAHRLQMANRGQAEVVERFGLDRMVRQHHDYYQRILRRPARLKLARAEKG
ncbi:MAG: glycosyltransferase, partial [Desulfuromonadales bacterium]|nr:glycosyltransferase [Desulfuromonadales bacterium]